MPRVGEWSNQNLVYKRCKTFTPGFTPGFGLPRCFNDARAAAPRSWPRAFSARKIGTVRTYCPEASWPPPVATRASLRLPRAGPDPGLHCEPSRAERSWPAWASRGQRFAASFHRHHRPGLGRLGASRKHFAGRPWRLVPAAAAARAASRIAAAHLDSAGRGSSPPL
jgi:hypothetical protein